MIDYVDLDRRFTEQSITSAAEGEDASDFSYYGHKLAWEDLLRRPRVVLLAGARAGKSYELENQAQKLQESGSAAFYIRLDLLGESTLQQACAPHDGTLHEWMSGTQEAWFFLDARDELAITGKTFKTALAHLREGLGSALSRGRILVSSRPADWRPGSDLSDFFDMLDTGLKKETPTSSPPPNDVEAWMNDPEDDEPSGPTAAAQVAETPLVVKMMPLDPPRIETLVKQWGLGNAAAFMKDLGDKNVLALAGLPGDLRGLVNLWKTEGGLVSYERVLESTVIRSVQDFRPIAGSIAQLSSEQRFLISRRLGALMTLTRSGAFLVRDDPTRAAIKFAIDAYEGFPDWYQDRVDEVLRTTLFDQPRYGFIHFHSRPIREYLAACWITYLRDHLGLSHHELHDIFLAQTHGELLVRPTMKPVAAWVALSDDYVLSALMERDPETLLTYGDPDQLPVGAKIELLERAVSKISTRGSSVFSYDTRILRVFAVPELTATIIKCWKRLGYLASRSRPRQDARILLLRLMDASNNGVFADIAYESAITPSPRIVIQQLALSTLVTLGAEAHIRKYVAALMRSPHRFEKGIALDAAADLFPKFLTTSQVLSLVAIHKNPAGEMDVESGHALSKVIPAAPTTKDRKALLAGLIKLLPPTREREKTKLRLARTGPRIDSWLSEAILEISARIFKEDKGVALSDRRVLEIIRTIQHQDEYLSEKGSREVKALLAESIGRRRLFWLLVDRMGDWNVHIPADARIGYRVSVAQSILLLSIADLEWLLVEDAAHRGEAVLSAAMFAWQRGGRPEATLERIRAYVNDNEHLAEELERYLNPAPQPPDEEFEAYQAAQKAERQQQREEQKEAFRSFRAELIAAPEIMTEDSEQKTPGQYRRLWAMRYWMEKKYGKRLNAYSLSNWRDLEEIFSVEVAKASAEGFKKYWRVHTPKLPSEVAANQQNTIENYTILGIVGLAIEASEGASWLTALSAGEVKCVFH